MLKKIIHILIIILGLLGIASTIIVIPVTSSFSAVTVLPAIIGIVFIAYGLLHLFRPGSIIKNKVFRVIVIICVVLVIISFVIIETLIIISANAKTPQKKASFDKANFDKVNFAIVLGAGVFPDGRLSQTLQNRLDKAYEYLNENEDIICVVSGGKGKLEPISEAEAMRDYLVSRGIEQDRIITESDSTSTKENLVFSAKLMKENYPDKPRTTAVITSDFHILRSLILAENSGIDAYGIPCATPLKVTVICYMREYLAIINTLLFQLD